MTKLFVPYKLAEDLKKIGFDEPCLAMYSDENLDMWLQDQYDLRSEGEEDGFQFKNSDYDDSRYVAAPLYQQVIDWFYEKHNIYIETKYFGGLTPKTAW